MRTIAIVQSFSAVMMSGVELESNISGDLLSDVMGDARTKYHVTRAEEPSVINTLFLVTPSSSSDPTPNNSAYHQISTSHLTQKRKIQQVNCESGIFCNESLHLLTGSVRESGIPEPQVRDDLWCSNLSTLIGSE